MGTVLIPIPDRDFDPTEVAVSWRVLTQDGHRVIFATESGATGIADDIMVSGRGLDIWSALPVLGSVSLIGRMLRANKDGRRCYALMRQSVEFQHPLSWAQATLAGVDALLLPGGHRARGMRSYIDSQTLQGLVVEAFAGGLIVAAICHGVLLAARSIDPATGRSVLYGRRTTALTWALERRARRHDSSPAAPAAGIPITTAPIPRSRARPADTCRCRRKSPERLKIPPTSVMLLALPRTDGSRLPAWCVTPRPTRGRRLWSTTAATCQRAGQVIRTRLRRCCRGN